MFGQDYEETQKRETRDRILALHSALHSSSDVQIGGAAAEMVAGARRGEIWRDQIVIFMFSARAGNISLAPIHFPPYLSALIPETLSSSSGSSTDPIRSALLLLPPAPSPSSSYPDVIYTHHRGKGFVGPIASRTIKIGGHIAKCPADRRVAHRNGSDWLSV